MFLAALGEEVEYPTAGLDNPIDAALVVDKSQDFDAIEIVVLTCPVENSFNGDSLPLGYTGGCNLDSVNVQAVQQGPRDAQFFRG